MNEENNTESFAQPFRRFSGCETVELPSLVFIDNKTTNRIIKSTILKCYFENR